MDDPRRPQREELARIIDPHAGWGRSRPSWKNGQEQGSARMAADRVQNWLAAHDREVEARALEAVIGQMKLTESRMPEWTHPLTEEPAPPSEEFQRGYREGRFKVQHVLGVLLSSTPATDPEPTETNGEQR